MRELFKDGIYLPVGTVLDSILEAAKNRGPMVVECQECIRCKEEFWVSHRFEEVIHRSACGQKYASQAKVYQDGVEAATHSLD